MDVVLFCSKRQCRFTLLASIVFVCSIMVTSTEAQGALFESSDLLQLRIEAPFRRMISNADERFPASMVLADTPGDTIHLELSARGKSRMHAGICDFPGLMLFFPDSTGLSLFEGQDAVPVVTHCKDRDDFEQLALLEFLAYRIYNVLTDLSLRVRQARFEYFDSERGRLVAERLGFFLENYDKLAARSGWVRLELPLIPPDEYDTSQRNLFEVFQYFIGNTDWSFAFPPPDETVCCHNAVPVGNPIGPVFPIPFDFDQAGLVDAPYATTDPSLRIRRVRQRLYRGICSSPEELNVTLGLFETRRPEIEALVAEADQLSDQSRRDVLRYVDEFYKTIADDRRVEREFLSNCRTP